MLKKSYIIFFFIINQGFSQLPYSNQVSYKNQSKQNNFVKMIDSLGYKYFDVTENLTNEELDCNFQSSRLQMLLFGMYQVSEKIVQSVSKNKVETKRFKINTNFHELRRKTLVNLKNSSKKLLENNDILIFLDFKSFIESINSTKAFILEIISYRSDLGNPYIPNKSNIQSATNSLREFEENRGADGLTDEQWLNVMVGGGGGKAPDLIRSTNRNNQRAFINLKKLNRVDIEAGEIQKIETFSDTIDGYVYIYSDFVPEQLSILYTSDNKFIEGLVNWLLYINAGNHIEVSQIFRLGANWNFQDADAHLIREVIDEHGNKIVLEFSNSNKINFSKCQIEKVKIDIDGNKIKFLGKSTDQSYTEELKPIFTIMNVSGDLLERIVININSMRKGLNDYDNTIMNLNRY